MNDDFGSQGFAKEHIGLLDEIRGLGAEVGRGVSGMIRVARNLLGRNGQ